jgi:hypothetical protein
VGGTTVGTQYSQLKITGTASLGGTLTAALVNTFTPAIGQSFTILTASSVSGTFTNSTIAINSSEHFAISYTATSVVLTVVSGPTSTGSSAQPAMQTAMVTQKPAPIMSTAVKVKGTLSRPITFPGFRKPVLVASAVNSKTILGGGGSPPRIWEHVPVAPSWDRVKAGPVAQLPRPVGTVSNLIRAENKNWVGPSHVIPVRGVFVGVHNPPMQTIRIMKPVLPRMR